MIPVLLDVLTIVFVVAGSVLLWVNLRQWRRGRVIVTPEEYDAPGDERSSDRGG